MELVSAVRFLLRRRILIAVGLLASVTIGLVVGGIVPPRGVVKGQATGGALAGVLVDTPRPLTGTTTSIGDDTVIQRAVMLGATMGSDAMSALISQRAGVPPQQLAVIGQGFDPVIVNNTYLPDNGLAQLAAIAARTAVHEQYVVRLVANYNVPILTIGASAPTVSGAVSLANATIATLRSASATSSNARAAARTANGSSNYVKQLGPVRGVTVLTPASSHHVLGLAAAIVLFLLWCIGIILASGVARLWRSTGLQMETATG